MGGRISHRLSQLKNQNIDIRIRMLFLVEYATFFACLIGTIVMILFASSIKVLIPNFAILGISGLGIYFTSVKKKYDLSVNLIIIGCAYIGLPVMYFTAGGNMSGMPIWFVFGTVFTCIMARGKSRIIMAVISIIVDVCCMMTGFLRSDLVIPLENETAEFYDMLQSFVIVSVMICACLIVYISTYDEQRKMLEQQREELARVTNIDALTGIANRRAYYEAVRKYNEGKREKDLVLVAMDVNGLKRVNDTLGHSAGDSYIKAAADIIRGTFSGYGEMYRTGGDEFVAVLNCSDKDAEKLEDILNSAVSNSNDEWAKNMTIAIGVALWNKQPEIAFSELEKLADSRMYQNKSEYYRKSGVDRRRR